jgi:hypothetical protein
VLEESSLYGGQLLLLLGNELAGRSTDGRHQQLEKWKEALRKRRPDGGDQDEMLDKQAFLRPAKKDRFS